MPQILITAEHFGELGKAALHLAVAQGFSFEVRSDVETELSGDERVLCSLVGNVEALVVSGKAKITQKVIKAGPDLKIISRRGVGFDNIDVAFAKEKGIWVTTTPQVVAKTVADHVLLLILGLARNIAAQDSDIRAGNWVRNRWSAEITGKTLGIIGFGRIGKMVALRAKAFEMNVMVSDPTIPMGLISEHHIASVALEDLLQASDFITLHVPLTDNTRRLMSRREFSLMKPGAFLINTSRGPVIDESALCDALREKRIAGAGLDVFENEPLPLDSPLRSLPNTLLTPHTAGNTSECWVAMEIAAIENAIAGLKGIRPDYAL